MTIGIPPALTEALEWFPDSVEITRVLASYEEGPGPELMGEGDYVWIVEFDDATRGVYVGWHDYTGWDCQSALARLPFDGWQGLVLDGWGRGGARTSAAAVVTEIERQLRG